MAELVFSEEEENYLRDRFRLSEENLDVFIRAAKRYGLNPIANQIYPQIRGNNMTITTGIDGYRHMADRTKCYAGNDDPVFDKEDIPRKATVTVYKIVHGTRCAFTASARWDQYFPGDKQGFMWRKMPHLMLGKCAEALALRKAFPAELSGIYTQEEMEQAKPADNAVDIVVEAPTPQREVPEERAAETPKEEFTRMVGEWSEAAVPKDVFTNAKHVLESLDIAVDGTATQEDFEAAGSFVKSKMETTPWHEFFGRKDKIVDAANKAAGSAVWE